MTDVVMEVSKKPIDPHVTQLVFEIVCDDKNGDDCEVRVCTGVY